MVRPGVMTLCAWLSAVALMNVATAGIASAAADEVEAARGVLRRTIGARVNAFQLELLPSDAADAYEVSAAKGIVRVRGNSAITLTRGAYDYLKSCCGGMVGWSGAALPLPRAFPDAPRKRVESPFRLRQYFNVCTFGYSTVWWDWPRWERELDWMALHGINMPLAMNGQEAIWLRVWASFGIARPELDDYFTGPAFLPWHRMGNVNGHGGPLDDDWIEEQRQLQKQILRRMRELGMRPIVPAFSGFVPAAFRKRHPDVPVFTNAGWANFPAGHETYVLAPNAPAFAEIGTRFIREYEREFGENAYYLADSFNELNVPVSKERRHDELAAYGAAVFRSINGANPRATWVMQGWLFGYDKAFWDRDSVRALLRDVPDDRMLILDLANDLFRGWKVHDQFYGKPWIYSVINNFGGNSPMRGDLRFFATDPAATIAAAPGKQLAGFGMAPEGIDNNEVVYELLTDAAWSRTPIDIGAWLTHYPRSRYGRTTPAIERAWQLLLRDVYGARVPNYSYRHAYQKRPSLDPSSDVTAAPALGEIATLFRQAPAVLQRNRHFQRDLADVGAQLAGAAIDEKLRAACAAHKAGDAPLRDTLAREAIAAMHALDARLARSGPRLSDWIASARAHGKTAAQQRRLEHNARLQVTRWGGPELHDYAAKTWSGLVKDFYAKRWELFFALLRRGVPEADIQSQLIAMETRWAEQVTGEVRAAAPTH